MTTLFERYTNPWHEFDRMNSLLRRAASNSNSEYPAVNVWVNGDDAVVTAEIPGIDSKTLDISVSDNTLTFRGTKPADDKREDESYHRHEVWNGTFSKTIQLPFNIDADRVSASYKRGILQISLPQRENDKPRKISIKSE